MRATNRPAFRPAVPTVAIVACCVVAFMLALASQASAAPHIAAQQDTVSLLGKHKAYSKASAKSKVVTTVLARRPITGQRTLMPVLAHKTDNRKRRWLRVRLPGRVLGHPTPPRTGWISASNTTPYTTAWHVLVNRAARTVTVYSGARKKRTFSAIVGAPSTPTPGGSFFVEENVRMPSTAAGAPFALALSARSSVFQEFEGGPGQVAIHGIANVGGEMGTASSHGCVRLSGDAVTWLAKRIGQGVPVTIT